MENNDVRDEQLWRIARKRAGFKRHLYTYIIMNAFFWVLWAVSHGRKEENGGNEGSFLPWPLWSMLGWGLGLAFMYYDAYHKAGGSLEQKEYEKLKEKENR